MAAMVWAGHSWCYGVAKGHEQEISLAVGYHVSTTAAVGSGIAAGRDSALNQVKSVKSADSLVLFTGINDIYRPVPAILADFSRLFEAARGKCSPENVFVVNIPDYDGYSKKISEVNSGLAALAEKNGFILIDLNSHMKEEGHERNLLHPKSYFGARRYIAEKISESLARMQGGKIAY